MAVALLLVAVVGILGVPARAVGAASTSPVITFATVPAPTAVAATPGQLVVLSAASCSTVYSVAANGAVSTFAILATTVTKCPEGAVAISPGLGNFAAGEVFVLLAGQLFEIPANGSSTPVHASLTFANLTKGNMGLTFDSTGSFGYALLATGGFHGATVQISATNEFQTVGTFGASVEGPAVAPLSFGTVGGDLVVAQSFTSTIYAMSPSGTVTTFAKFGAPAEQVSFVPALACAFSTTGDSYFVADATTNSLLAVPSSAFNKITGSGLVQGETRGAGVLHPNGTASLFLRMTGTLKAAAYVACPVGVAQAQDLGSRGLNGTALNLIGYDPATQQLVGTDPTQAPSQIFVLNGSTLAFVRNVSTGLDPAAVAFNPSTDTLFVANTGSDNLTVLNASTYQELGNVSTGAGSAPIGVAYNSGNQKLYVANSGNDTIDVFSLANRVFPNQNQVIALSGMPLGLVVDPKDGDVYVVGNVSGAGIVWEIHAFKLIQTLSVGTDALAIAVNNGTGTLYVTVYGSNQLVFIAPGDNLTSTIPLPLPVGVAFDPRNGLLFVDSADGNMRLLQGTTVIASYLFGANPGPLIYDPDSGLVYGAADVTIFGVDPRIIIGGSG
ncbi:MAG TPA: YncE family protein [Thermoplasmata archaeon]|nr:YncE family protein [Thermoplasmata archaeon]